MEITISICCTVGSYQKICPIKVRSINWNKLDLNRPLLKLTCNFRRYFAFFSKRIRFGTSLPYQIGAGTVSGLMGGFFGMHGPPAVLYFISSEPDKEHYMGMIQTYFVITNAMMTLVRASNGFVTAAVGKSYLFCLAAVGIGAFAGGWAFRHIPGKIFPYVVYGYIGISGMIILLTS